jgi:hypothetical protein
MMVWRCVVLLLRVCCLCEFDPEFIALLLRLITLRLLLRILLARILNERRIESAQGTEDGQQSVRRRMSATAQIGTGRIAISLGRTGGSRVVSCRRVPYSMNILSTLSVRLLTVGFQ